MLTQPKKSLRRLGYTPMIQINTDYIAHHGILGQKWGVRRFQNKDGSLKPAGRKRYNSGEGDEKQDIGLGRGVRSSGKKPGIAVPLAVAGATLYGLGAKKAFDESKSSASNNPDKKGDKSKDKDFKDMSKSINKGFESIRQYRNAGTSNTNAQINRYNTRKTLSQKEMDDMSDADLQKLVNRLNLETNYSRLTQEPEAIDKVDIGLQRTQAILGIVGSTVAIGAGVYKISEKLRNKAAS